MAIESNLNANEQILITSLEMVNANISTLIARLASDSNGRFLSDTLSLQQALNTRVDIAIALTPYNDAVRVVTGAYVEAAKDAAAAATAIGIDTAFSQSDANLIDAMIADSREILIAAGVDVSGRLSEQMYLSVASGGSKSDMLEIVRQFTLGKTDKAGRPLANHAATITQDAYMSVDSVVTERIALNNGIDRFQYQGSLVTDSRPWCAEHINKIYSKAEIAKFDGGSWAGKKPGSTMTNRGGYNCRHHWRIVV